MRLDIYISQKDPTITRSQAKRLIEDGHVQINGKAALKASLEVKASDEVSFKRPKPVPTSIIAEDIPLNILYEDRDIVVVNKCSNMVVHPAAGNYTGTLVNALMHHCKDLSGIGGELRPGIVHRLDKGTSGVMVVAKNDAAHLSLSKQFKDRTTEKHYYALVQGNVKGEEGVISKPIGRHPVQRKKMSTKSRHGRVAETKYKVIERFGGKMTLVDIRLMTGRTHQIRVHFSQLGHPLVGDKLYGGRVPFLRPALHAYKLILEHPRTKERVTFEAPIPKDMDELLNELRKV